MFYGFHGVGVGGLGKLGGWRGCYCATCALRDAQTHSVERHNVSVSVDFRVSDLLDLICV